MDHNMVIYLRLYYNGGSINSFGQNKIAPNDIFRVVSSLCILCDLTYLISLKNSTHSRSYEA